MIGDSPWREVVRFGEVGRGPVKRSLQADETARKAIARLLGIVSVESLKAELTIRPWMDGAEIDGSFTADIVQTCSVTAEPFEETAEADFVIRVLPPGSVNAPQDPVDEIELDLEADDPPDVLEGEDIDLGGYVVEHLALELDPFPRKPGAEFLPPRDDTDLSPFAVLRMLKKDDAPE